MVFWTHQFIFLHLDLNLEAWVIFEKRYRPKKKSKYKISTVLLLLCLLAIWTILHPKILSQNNAIFLSAKSSAEKKKNAFLSKIAILHRKINGFERKNIDFPCFFNVKLHFCSKTWFFFFYRTFGGQKIVATTSSAKKK